MIQACCWQHVIDDFKQVMTHTQFLYRRDCAPYQVRTGGDKFAFRLLSVLVAAMMLGAPLANPATVSAQDNPFGESGVGVDPGQGGDAPQDTRNAPPIPDDLPEDARLIVEATRKSNPQTPVELARAIRGMLDLEQVDEARWYLSKLIQAGPSQRQMYEMYQQVGADFFLQLHSEDALAPDGRQLAEEVFAAARKLATDPAKVDSLVRQLSHENSGFRSNALAQLRRLGAPAAAAILMAFTDETRQSEFPYLRAALDQLGADAAGPLLAAVRSGNARLQVEAVRALGYMPVSVASESLIRWYLGPDISEPMRQMAAESLARHFDVLPDSASGQRLLSQRIRGYLSGDVAAVHAPGDVVEVWYWDAGAGRFGSRTVSQTDASRIHAAWLADDLLAIAPDDFENRRVWLVARLDAAKRLAGPNQRVTEAALGVQRPLVRIEDLDHALSLALDWDAIAAATGICELMRDRGELSLLASRNGRPSAIIRAVLSGQRHLQFAAFETVVQLDPKQAFGGSSYVMQLAVFLAASRGESDGLVGHRHQALAQTFSSIMSRSGLVRGIGLGSGVELFEEARWNPDVDVVFVTDGIAAPYFHELVFQLRNDWRTRRLPIAVMIREPGQQRRAEKAFGNDSLTKIYPGTLDEALVASQIRRLKELQRPWPITVEQRLRHAAVARRFLERVLADRDSYGFFEPHLYESRIVRGLTGQVPSEVSARILGHLGSALAQQALADIVGRRGIEDDVRRAAAESFAMAVRRNGLLLSPGQIKLQFDLLQASEGIPGESDQIQARLIQAIQDVSR